MYEGMVTYSVNTNNKDILRTLQSHKRHECLKQLLKCLITTKRQSNTAIVTTADIHLARGIDEAVSLLSNANLNYPEENLLRAY